MHTALVNFNGDIIAVIEFPFLAYLYYYFNANGYINVTGKYT